MKRGGGEGEGRGQVVGRALHRKEWHDEVWKLRGHSAFWKQGVSLCYLSVMSTACVTWDSGWKDRWVGAWCTHPVGPGPASPLWLQVSQGRQRQRHAHGHPSHGIVSSLWSSSSSSQLLTLLILVWGSLLCFTTSVSSKEQRIHWSLSSPSHSTCVQAHHSPLPTLAITASFLKTPCQ